MDSSLSLSQFQQYMNIIRTMLDKIEQEQTNKLKSISEVKGENMSQQVTLGAIRGASSQPSMDFGSLSVSSPPPPKVESGDSKKVGMTLQEKEAAMKQQQEEARLRA